MKKLLLLLSLTTAFAATEPSTVTFNVTITGTSSASDARAAKFVVNAENTRRITADPLAVLLATNNAAAYRASYITLLGQRVAGWHGENIAASVNTPVLTDDDFQNIKKAIVDQLNSGKTPAQIITAINQ